MAYTGDTRPGGPAETREVDGLSITKLAVGPYDNNAYLLRCAATGTGLLIDAAAEPARLAELIGDTPVPVIVTTHRHGDHWQALRETQRLTGATVAAHPADASELPVAAGLLARDGDRLEFGAAAVTVIHLRGHTPGSIALCYDAGGRLAATPHLFTGDSLFPGGPGRTTRPEDFNSLMTGLETEIFGRLPDETWIYPGHGADSTIGTERPHLAEWWARRW